MWIIESHWLKYFEKYAYTPNDVSIDIKTLSISMEAGVSIDKLQNINIHNLIKDLEVGINLLHSHGIIHGDIKPPNIIRCGVVFKLIDFEAANFIGYPYGALPYSEGFRHPKIACIADTRYDWWAAAATIYLIWSGRTLTDKRKLHLAKHIRRKIQVYNNISEVDGLSDSDSFVELPHGAEIPTIAIKIMQWCGAKSNTDVVTNPIDQYDKFIIYNELCGNFMDERIIARHKKNIAKLVANPLKFRVFRNAQECALNQHTLTSILGRTNGQQSG